MANAIAGSHALRSSLLQLPAHLRVAAYRQSIFTPVGSSRLFSATVRRKNDNTGPIAAETISEATASLPSFTDFILAPSNLVIDSLHSIGLPWFMAIPATALLVRGLLVYPFSAIPGRRRARIQNNLSPLVSAYTRVNILRNLQRNGSQPKSGEIGKKIRLEGIMLWSRLKNLHEAGKSFGAPLIKPSSFLNLLALLSFTEALRRKCGASDGLFSMLLSPFRLAVEKVLPGTFAPPPSTGASNSNLEQLEAALQLNRTQALGADGSDITQLSSQLPGLEPTSAVSNVDPTLHLEGLSWCLDLTAPDPTFILPMTLGVTMAASVLISKRIRDLNHISQNTSTISEPEDLSKGLASAGSSSKLKLTFGERIRLSMAWLLGIAATQMPVAILLYFIPSVFLGFVQTRILDWRMPMPKTAITPCKRPLRQRARKDPYME